MSIDRYPRRVSLTPSSLLPGGAPAPPPRGGGQQGPLAERAPPMAHLAQACGHVS